MKTVRMNHPVNLTAGLICLMLSIFSCSISRQWEVADPAAFVNPFIGTAGEASYRHAANTVPGAVRPFGMLNFGPEAAYTEDLLSTGRASRIVKEGLRMPVSPGGYNYAASRIRGFSLTRLSGTGCLGASGDIPILPFTNAIVHSPDTDKLDSYYSSGFSHDNETAVPGYYQVRMENGVNVELTATDRSGMARFTFPADSTARLIFRTAYSQLGSGDAWSKVDTARNEVVGSVTSGNFCGYLGEYNRRDYYTLYFVACIDAPISDFGSWQDDKVRQGSDEARGGMGYGENGIPKVGKGSGVWVTLNTESGQPVRLRVGISYVSLDNARANLEAEQAGQPSFDVLRIQAYDSWKQCLSKVAVACEDTALATTFYTALYHTQFHPNIFSDVNGQYAGFDGKTHQLADGQAAQYANFSGWDVYRSQLQLVTLMHPERAGDIAHSLYNQASQYNGIWDRWTHNSGPTAVMNGDPATIAMANFQAFGAKAFDVEAAYASLAKAAKTPTEFDLSPVGRPIFSRGQKPSLDQWQKLNYISDDCNAWEGASETLEQASAFFALSQLADRLGHTDDAQRFLKESGYWKNLFNENAHNGMGYIQGRMPDGSWKKPFDPASPNLFVEGSPLQYLWMVPFDGAGLIEKMGGPEKAVPRLDGFFKKPDGSWALYREGGAYSDLSNQPSLDAPWMYLFTGRADKSQETLRAVLDLLWFDGVTGIPGQDDLGQMSSWYVFTSLGLYPLYPGRAEMVLGSPVFSKAAIRRHAGDILIEAPAASRKNIYVNSLKVNGTSSFKPWINEDYIKKGVVLKFDMTADPSQTFGGLEQAPPSFSVK